MNSIALSDETEEQVKKAKMSSLQYHLGLTKRGNGRLINLAKSDTISISVPQGATVAYIRRGSLAHPPS